MQENTKSVNTPSKITLLNTPVHMVTMGDVLAFVSRSMTEPRLHQIATTNPEFVMAAQQDEQFRQVLWQADLCIPDGIGLVWASRLKRTPLPQRVPGSELVYKLAEMAARNNWPLYLLGAGSGIAEQAAAVLQQNYPQLAIAGTYAGSPDPAQNEEIVGLINQSGAQMLFVAYGAPKQDLWIARNRKTLSQVRLAMGVGGSLDFISGKANRAPKWVQDLGLEWLHRLAKEPWRWRRMLALPRFAFKVLITSQ